MTITLDEAKRLLAKGCIVWPYPRKGQVSVNGGRAQPATKAAIEFARAWNRRPDKRQ